MIKSATALIVVRSQGQRSKAERRRERREDDRSPLRLARAKPGGYTQPRTFSGSVEQVDGTARKMSSCAVRHDLIIKSKC
jgi:hypothetical protein